MLTLTGESIGEKQLPLRFYQVSSGSSHSIFKISKTVNFLFFQIGNKFRDEKSPRYGLIRAREFIMKDLYTFDIDKEHAMQTYDEISEIYGKLFKYLGIPFAKGSFP